MAQHALDSGLELWPLIAAVSVKLQQEWIQTEQGRHHQDTTVSVLNIGRMYDGVHQQALSIYKDMALLAFDLLASVKAMGIDPSPPFSALFTLWLSIIAAVGLAWRLANSRHFT
jgi:hypothetical protein